MSDFIENLKAVWVGSRQREFHNRTRGIMTPEDRRILEEEFDCWLEQVKAEAWEEGKRAEETAWMHIFDGHPVAEGEFCDECSTENPYRKGVEDE